MDQFLELFAETFGPAKPTRPVHEQALRKFDGVLPRPILDLWRWQGRGGFAQGLVWTIDPDEYSEQVDSWISGTSLYGKDRFVPIMRTAFDSLKVWACNSGSHITT